MPSPKGLQTFIRQEPITDEEWLDLIEVRRAMIKPHLDSSSLSTLGDLQCLHSEGHSRELRIYSTEDLIISGSVGYSLKTQGIFELQPFDVQERYPNTGYQRYKGDKSFLNGKKLAWGLSRSNQWLLIAIHYEGRQGYKERGCEMATEVYIEEVDLPTLIAKTQVEPQKIWQHLGETIKRWTENRRLSYQGLLSLKQMVETEELALSLIPALARS